MVSVHDPSLQSLIWWDDYLLIAIHPLALVLLQFVLSLSRLQPWFVLVLGIDYEGLKGIW